VEECSGRELQMTGAENVKHLPVKVS